MAEPHPEALSVMRGRYPDLRGVPDELVAGLAETVWTSLGLYVRDLGRALLAPLRKLR